MPASPSSSMSSRLAVERPGVGSTTMQRGAQLSLAGDNADIVRKAVIPDALAVTMGMQLQETADMAAYQILKPLFLTDLPLPWEVQRRHHGRYDFYHPGSKEYRREHPMIGFFKDVLEFLRANATTSTPMEELLEAQVFKEASPEVVRYRLGIWEGPIEDKSSGGLMFVRQWDGIDEACVKVDQRFDDPRLEAAANLSFRLGGWLHLWRGFIGEEPFPLLEGRLAALCQQLGESVVTAPGMATTQMIAHMEQLLPRLVPPTPPPEPVRWPFTEDEKALQPLVTTILSKAYNAAISEAARRETEAAMFEGRIAGDSDRFAARVTCNMLYRASQRLVADLEHQDWAAAQFPPEEEQEAEYSDDLEEDPFDEDEEEDQTSEDDVEEVGERKIEDHPQPRTPEDEVEAEEEEDPEDVIAHVEDPEILVEETDDVRPVIETCKGFIASLETDHGSWAHERLRPWTPSSRRQSAQPCSPKALWPESPKVTTHRPRLGRKQRVWRQTGFQEGEELDEPEELEELSPTDQVARALLAHAMAGGMAPEVAVVAQALFDHAMAATSPHSEEADTLPMMTSLEERDLGPAMPQDEQRDEAEETYEDEFEEEEQDAEQLGAGKDSEELSPELTEDTQEPLLEETTEQPKSENYWPLLDMELKPELQEKVDSFSRRLAEATSIFNHCTGDDGSYDVDDFLCSVSWNWSTSEPENSDSYRTGRADLARAAIQDPLSRKFDGAEADDYEMVETGAAARPPSPKRGKMRQPWYLEDANEPPSGLAAGQPAFPLERARSSSPKLVRKSPMTAKQQAKSSRLTRRGIGKPPPKAKLEPRPRSADCYTRPRTDDLLPFRPAAAAVEAAKSTKRFLSRTCGTMQAALATFDPNGDGRFSREEWTLGLQQLDFTVNYDEQEIFTVLDRRGHHMLTLSDLLDYCSGIPIDTGMPAPGLRGTVSELFEEVIEEQLKMAVREALDEVALQGLQNPNGPTSSLPDVQGYLRQRQKRKKLQERDGQSQNQPSQAASSNRRKQNSMNSMNSTDPDDSGSEEIEPDVPQEPEDEDPSNGKAKGGAKAAAKSGPKVGRTPPGSSEAKGPKAAPKPTVRGRTPPGSSESVGRGLTPQTKPGAKGGPTPPGSSEAKAKASAKSGARGGQSPPGSSEVKEKGDKKKKKADEGDSSPGSPSRSPKRNSSKHRKDPADSATFANALGRVSVESEDINPNEEIKKAKKKIKPKAKRHSSEDGKKRVRSHSPERSYMSARNQPQPIAKFYGYSFVDREDFGKDVPDTQLLPFVPRPASEICKTYGHIFRILADPGVRRLKVEPRKRSVHVFMPSTGSSFEPERDGGGDTFDEHKEKDFGLQASKSTPDLRTTQASTTAGTTWRYASESSEVRQDRVSLPPLVQSQNQRPELPSLGGAAAIDAECRRNPAALRAEGSQGTL